jgi:hypothetical protein
MSAATSFGTAASGPTAVLGKDVTVIGEIRSHEPLTIEGEVEGTIDVTGHLLTIAPTGQVGANVKAKEIDILGSLEGNIDQADIIYIRAGARFLWRYSRASHCHRGRRFHPRQSGSIAPVQRCRRRLVKGLVHGVERGDELHSQNIRLRSRKVLDPEPFVASLEQLMPVEPPATAQFIGRDLRRELVGEGSACIRRPAGFE